MHTQASTFSWITFLSLALTFGASLTMFLWLVRMWTTQRRWTLLGEWAAKRELRFRKKSLDQLPAALDRLRERNVTILVHLGGDEISVMQLQTEPRAGEVQRWNVAVRRRPTISAESAGLRPVDAPTSLFDSFHLSQYPSLTLGHRFVVLGESSSAARALSESASRTLLPADLGLLLTGQWIVLDFSSRAFDPIELDRMFVLSRQLSQLL